MSISAGSAGALFVEIMVINVVLSKTGDAVTVYPERCRFG